MTALASGKSQCAVSSAMYTGQLGAGTFIKVSVELRNRATIGGIPCSGKGRVVYKYTAGTPKWVCVDKDEFTASVPLEISGDTLIIDPYANSKGHVAITTSGTFVESNGFHVPQNHKQAVDAESRASFFVIKAIDTTLDPVCDLSLIAPLYDDPTGLLCPYTTQNVLEGLGYVLGSACYATAYGLLEDLRGNNCN